MEPKLTTWEEAVAWLKNQPEKADLVRACFFDDPLPAAAERYYKSAEWREVRNFLQPNKRRSKEFRDAPQKLGLALDVGAGMGISSFALVRDGWDVVALEPDPSDIVGAGAIRSLFATTGLRVTIEQTWGEKLPFPDNTFTVVHCRQVLHHARDLGQLGRELGRVLKPGGVFIATREHVLARKGDLPKFLAAHPLHKFYGGENAYLLAEYLTALKEGGIHVTKVLNPFASEINLFPETKKALKRRLAAKIRFPLPDLIPDSALSWVGKMRKVSGALYSFVGTKH